MGEYRELRADLDKLESKLLNELVPSLREMQKALSDRLLEALNVAGQIRVASERFINRANDEIDAEGGGHVGRRKRSTDLGGMGDKADAPSAVADDPSVPKVPVKGAVVLPPGKRGCGNCGQPGHRKTSCPLPDKKANKPMGKRGCSKCGKPGHRAPTCPN